MLPVLVIALARILGEENFVSLSVVELIGGMDHPYLPKVTEPVGITTDIFEAISD